MQNSINKDLIRTEMIHFLSGGDEGIARTIGPDNDLKSLGIDSFRIIELVLFLERKFELPIPEAAFTPGNLRSVDSIINCALEFAK